ncbi:hypothetical protein AB0J38_26015 [Streptomyces sp. NPDC050095]|uniref:hypothetical protein n=1 Tax=unclassified Streptomyces TaxID=2593676 RepID=UPI00342E5DE5
MPTRVFTPEQLDQIGVPFELDGEGCATELGAEQVGSRRWSSIHDITFRAPDDGKAYTVRYQLPLTEHQECDVWFDEQQITAVEVEERPKVVTTWEPVGERPACQNSKVTDHPDFLDDGEQRGPFYRFTDADGDFVHVGVPASPAGGTPAVSLCTSPDPVHVPVERVAELCAELRRLAAQ